MNVFQKYNPHIRQTIIVAALGVLLAAGITFAWGTNTWNEPNDWVADGGVISAQKLGQNLRNLNKRINDLSGQVGTVSNAGLVTIEANQIGWKGPSTAYGMSFTGSDTATASGKSICFLTTTLGTDVRDNVTWDGGCILTNDGTTWTLRAIADARHATKCAAMCLPAN